MTPLKPQISKFKAEKSCQVGFNVHGGSTHERLLSELSRPYMLAYYLSAFIDCAYFLVVWSHVLQRKHKRFSSCTWGKN
jgi:hypothetical protein